MSGGLRIPPGTPAEALPSIPRQRDPSWARPDPVDELAERLADFAAAAVHPDEIAALLESDGLSDEQIRERYGVKNSFALAEELYDRVPRAYPEPAGPVGDPWRVGLVSCLLRGVVFALPGLAYVLGAPFLVGPKDDAGLPAGTVPLLSAALFGWAWNQGLAHRAYTWLGLGDRTAARRALLVGGPAGALLGTLVATATAGTASATAVAFAGGQSCYVAAATALLVLGRERALLAALLPMTAGATLTLLHPVPHAARIVLLLGSLATVVVLALREAAPPIGRRGLAQWCGRASRFLRGCGRSGRRAAPATAEAAPRKRGRAKPTHAATSTPGALAGSLPYALFGLGSGTLVVYAALGDVLADTPAPATAAPSAVALTLSMGPAEWLLHRFRGRTTTALRHSRTPTAFRRSTARTVATCLTAYLTTLAALTLTTTALWPHSPAPALAHLAALLLLGVVLWTGLLLQSFGAVLGAATICCAAALAQTLALATHTGSPHGTGLIVHGTAAVAQAALVCALLGRVTAHR
ncbi:hypothetical protein [Streptomyces sp. NPDC003635]